MIQLETGDGEELINFALATLRDETKPHDWRWKALELLVERAYGKAMQPVELQAHLQQADEDQRKRLPTERLSPEDLEHLNRIMNILGASEPAPRLVALNAG
jgi:hypothetical protein